MIQHTVDLVPLVSVNMSDAGRSQSTSEAQDDAELNAPATHPGDEAHEGEERAGSEQPAEAGSIPERLPDTFAEFMADGDVRTSPNNFFAGLFRKATDSLESSLHHAQQTSTDALNTAQTAGSSAFSAVSGIVRDIGNGLADPSQSPPSIVTGFAVTTRSIKSFRIPSAPLLLLPPAEVICRSSICIISPTGRVLERSIAPTDVARTDASPAKVAARMPDSQLILGLDTGVLRVLSLAGSRPTLVLESAMQNSSATALCAGDNVVAVGTEHGHTNILNISDLSLVKTITPPSLCAVQLGAALRHAPVSCLAVSRDNFLLMGYEDGTVKFSSMADDFVQIPFVAHSRSVSGVLLFYDVLAITIGSETDPSLAVFDAYTGRCLSRRMLPYAPHSLGKRRCSRAPEPGVICPSELNFMVGGAEGQVEVFRLVVLSPEKVELHLVKTFSGRVRGKNRAVIQVAYVSEQALLLALSASGELRRWQVSKEDGGCLALLDEELALKPQFTQENIVTAADQDFSLPDGSRLNSVSGVIKAQNILAGILDNERISEAEKDRIVTEFQRRQAEMLLATSQGDTELRRARRRIISRFGAGLRASNTNGTVVNVELAKAAKRTAAFEIEFATRRHAESQDGIQKSAIADLKSILQGFLKRLPTDVANDLESMKSDIDTLGRGDTETDCT